MDKLIVNRNTKLLTGNSVSDIAYFGGDASWLYC